MDIKVTLEKFLLKRLGLAVANRIRENTIERNVDRFGRKFQDYSTNTVAIPAGALLKKARKTLRSDGRLSYFRRNNSLWVAVRGGYSAIKRATRPNQSGVNLFNTGAMMRGLTVIDVQDGSVKLGWRDRRLSELAYFHNQAGVGSSRVKREFLGLPDSELSEIVNDLFELMSPEEAIKLFALIVK